MTVSKGRGTFCAWDAAGTEDILMIYCKCEQCNSIVLFQEGEIGHNVFCGKCGAGFTLSVRQVMEPPVVEDRPGKGRLLKFWCECGRKLALPLSMRVERVKCPRCERMVPVPPAPPEKGPAALITVTTETGREVPPARRRPKMHPMTLVVSLCWIAFLLCAIGVAGGLIASEVKLRRVEAALRRLSEQEEGPHAEKSEAGRASLEKERNRWLGMRQIVVLGLGPPAGITFLAGVVMALLNRVRKKRKRQRVRGMARAAASEASSPVARLGESDPFPPRSA